MLDYKVLKELSDSFGVIGDEEERYKIIEKYLKSWHIKFRRDKAGNLIVGEPTATGIVLASHVDEIGVEVTKLRNDGLIEFKTAGYIHPNTLLNSHFDLKVRGKEVRGYVISGRMFGGGMTDYFLTQTDLLLDVGAVNYQELKDIGIQVGTLGSYPKHFEEKKDRIMATGIDNCVGVFMNLSLIKQYRNNDVSFVFHNGEENGSNGAVYFTKNNLFKYALILDYFPAKIDYEKLGEKYPEIDKGPAVFSKAQNYSLHDDMLNNLSELGLPVQFCITSKPSEVGHFETNGSVGINICVPARGFHGANYVISKKDIASTLNYTQSLVQKLLQY